MTSALEFHNVSIRYPRRETNALEDVSFRVDPGMITAVVGPNGSGKSTLVRALLRRVALAGGDIRVHGEALSDMRAREFARAVAVVPQREEPSLPLPVREFIELGRHPHRGALSALSSTDNAAIESAIVLAGIGDTILRETDQLSGGEWQRVRIARALAQDAATIVLDEPTAFLDIAHEMAVFELLDALAKSGRSVLLISHQLNLVARFATRIVLLHHGHIAAEGTASDVMQGEILERVYEWPLVITRDPAVGALSLLPLRKRAVTGL
jgi:iron complex transport system ATP-binding protein